MLRSALFLLLATTSPAIAQMEYAPGFVPRHGQSDEAARALIWARMNAPEHARVNCWKLGCVLIVNESNYDVVGFFVNAARPNKNPRWSQNQLQEPLLPSKVTLRFKTGNADTCNLPVRFTLLNRETHERAEVTGTTSFCTSPHNDSLVRIRMNQGKVYVRGDDDAEDGAG